MRPTDAATQMLWQQHVETLRAGIRARKPDAADRVRLEIRKIEGELAPVVRRRAIVDGCKAAGEPVQPALEVVLDANIAALRSKLKQLHAVLRETKAAPIADTGATPEVAARPLPMQDIPEAHRQAAEDLRSGWISKTARTQAARSRFDELPGQAGQVAERFELAFDHWQLEMQRLKLWTWPVLLVVCEGRSVLQASQAKRVDPRIIALMLQVGLLTYELAA